MVFHGIRILDPGFQESGLLGSLSRNWVQRPPDLIFSAVYYSVYYSVYDSDLFFSRLGVNNWGDGCPGLGLVVPVYCSVYHTVHYSPNVSNIIFPATPTPHPYFQTSLKVRVKT